MGHWALGMGKRTKRQEELGTSGKTCVSSHPLSPCPLVPLSFHLPLLPSLPTPHSPSTKVGALLYLPTRLAKSGKSIGLEI